MAEALARETRKQENERERRVHQTARGVTEFGSPLPVEAAHGKNKNHTIHPPLHVIFSSCNGSH